MKMFKPFDYFTIVVGVIGTLIFLGVLSRMPQLVMVTFGVLSSMICYFSILLLALDRFGRHLDSQQARMYRFNAIANIIPPIYVFTHLKETASEYFLF
jgi:hypothetical protein